MQPNPGHFTMAEIEHRVPFILHITQNVDGLHRRAGSKNIIELHGNITRIRCPDGCGVISKRETAPGGVPKCPIYAAKLHPDVVWFGEMLPTGELKTAMHAAPTVPCSFQLAH